MVRFIEGLVFAAIAGAAYATLAEPVTRAAGVHQLMLVLAILFAIAIYAAAAYGAPRLGLISHVYGLATGASALWVAWVLWSGLTVGETAAAPADLGALGWITPESWHGAIAEMARVAQFSPRQWLDHLRELSGSPTAMAYIVEDFSITGDRLMYFWAAEAALALLAGLAGGHAGRQGG